MRSIGDLMKEMGFNKDAPMETQKAFIRHLIRAANETSRTPATPIEAVSQPVLAEQLSFDPEILGMSSKKQAAR